MDRSVRLTYRYHDVDLLELTASAWNGEFGGSTRLYIRHGQLAEAADLLAGFPESVEDFREVKFGEFGPQFGAGAIALQFSCSDRAGHCQLLLKLEADPIPKNPPLQRVEMSGAIEPSALDLFVEQMRTLDSSL